MNKLFLLISVIGLGLSGCSSENAEKKSDKINLSFHPDNNKPLKMNYEFAVNSITTGNMTRFVMALSGTSLIDSNDIATLIMQNDKISMNGVIGGKEVNFEAGTKDSIPADVGMVLTPIFTLLHKKFQSSYDSRLNKLSEVCLREGGIDSAENKMQLFIRYPDSAVAIGDSWNKELVIKAGNKMNCSAKYTLKEVKSNIATISMVGILTGKGESFGHDFTIDGEVTGTFTVDLKTGWPINTDIDQDFVLNLSGQKIQMKYAIKNSVNY